jgi:hypothetical protein
LKELEQHSKKEVATTVANTWEELTFDYTGVAM